MPPYRTVARHATDQNGVTRDLTPCSTPCVSGPGPRRLLRRRPRMSVTLAALVHELGRPPRLASDREQTNAPLHHAVHYEVCHDK